MNDKERNTPCNLQYKGVSINGSEENELPLCMENKVRVPIHLKLTLTIKEAAEYSNIGINKIDTLLKQPNCPFVLFVGTRKLVKRREFEEYIRRELIIWNFYQQLLQKIPVEIEKAESLCYNIQMHWTLFLR